MKKFDSDINEFKIVIFTAKSFVNSRSFYILRDEYEFDFTTTCFCFVSQVYDCENEGS